MKPIYDLYKDWAKDADATVAERPITLRLRFLRALAGPKLWLERKARKAESRRRIKDVEEEHLFHLRAEGYKIVYDRTGWSVSFKQKQDNNKRSKR